MRKILVVLFGAIILGLFFSGCANLHKTKSGPWWADGPSIFINDGYVYVVGAATGSGSSEDEEQARAVADINARALVLGFLDREPMVINKYIETVQFWRNEERGITYALVRWKIPTSPVK
ncbi:MAG: hypothetical protein PHR36_02380 [Patescibacteria group bacterium]|nr:hypothetical protein [Patescibacteria group bacterium]